MRVQDALYVACVAVVAAIWAASTIAAAPAYRLECSYDALLACGLALTAELLSYLLPKAATGSIGFIPYFAAADCCAELDKCCWRRCRKDGSGAWRRRAPIKARAQRLRARIDGAWLQLPFIRVSAALLCESLTPVTSDARHTRQAGVQALAAFVAGACLRITCSSSRRSR